MADQLAAIRRLRELRKSLPAEMIHHEGKVFDAAQETLSPSEPHLNYKDLDLVVALANACDAGLLDAAERGMEMPDVCDIERAFVGELQDWDQEQDGDPLTPSEVGRIAAKHYGRRLATLRAQRDAAVAERDRLVQMILDWDEWAEEDTPDDSRYTALQSEARKLAQETNG